MKKFLITVLCLLTLVACGSSNNEVENKIDLTKVSSLEDIKGINIAYQNGTLQEDLVSQIEDGDLKGLDSFDSMAMEVLAGTVEGAIMDEPVAIVYGLKNNEFAYVPFINNENGFAVDPEEYENACAFYNNDELLNEVNSVLETIPMEKCYELMEEIIKVSNGQNVTSFCLENDEPTEYKGTLRVGMECASEPFNWTDIDATSYGAVDIYSPGYEGMKANGLDVQIAKYIANALGYKLEVYAIEWDSLLESLKLGQIDCIIGNMSPTQSRKDKGFTFSNSYYNVNYVVLYKK